MLAALLLDAQKETGALARNIVQASLERSGAVFASASGVVVIRHVQRSICWAPFGSRDEEAIGRRCRKSSSISNTCR
jgi:hypothetical protein